jgi:hypothetical protein
MHGSLAGNQVKKKKYFKICKTTKSWILKMKHAQWTCKKKEKGMHY